MRSRNQFSVFGLFIVLGAFSALPSHADSNWGLPTFCFPGLSGLPGMSCETEQSTSASSWPGQWTQGSFSGETGSRNYYLYVPKNTPAQGALPLVVMLHGCQQDAKTFAAQTGMNTIAEQFGFAVVYPEQTSQYNPMSCWNWFDADSQARDSGELAIVVGIVRKVEGQISIDTNRVYVGGLSAGAALASNLAACYADVFSGAGIASGLDYKAATSQNDAWLAMSQGPQRQDIAQSAQDAVECTGTSAHPLAILSIQGKSDPFVNPINAQKVVEQFVAINDLLDDGQANHSQNMSAIWTRTDQAPNGGYTYSTSVFGGSGKILVGQISVNGMSHAWSGAAQSGQFADPRGPNFSLLMWQFFSQYAVGR